MREDEHVRKTDFEHPPLLYLAEDRLKGLLGGPLLYNPFIEKNGGFRGDEQVLDFGCGGGVGTRCIAERLTRGGKVTGVDISSAMLNRAGKRLRRFVNARLVLGDIRSLGLEKDAFDVISIVHVLHDIDSDQRASHVDAMAALLRENGRIWILEPTRQGHGMQAAEIRAMMRNAGLEEILCDEGRGNFRGVFQVGRSRSATVT